MAITVKKTKIIRTYKCESCKDKMETLDQEITCFICGKKCCYSCSRWSSNWTYGIGSGTICKDCRAHIEAVEEANPKLYKEISAAVVAVVNKAYSIKIKKVYEVDARVKGSN